MRCGPPTPPALSLAAAQIFRGAAAGIDRLARCRAHGRGGRERRPWPDRGETTWNLRCIADESATGPRRPNRASIPRSRPLDGARPRRGPLGRRGRGGAAVEVARAASAAPIPSQSARAGRRGRGAGRSGSFFRAPAAKRRRLLAALRCSQSLWTSNRIRKPRRGRRSEQLRAGGIPNRWTPDRPAAADPAPSPRQRTPASPASLGGPGGIGESAMISTSGVGSGLSSSPGTVASWG